MSEPEGVFIKLEIERPQLIRWLGARPSPASRWNDWRDLGGSWHFGGGDAGLTDASDAHLQELLAVTDRTLASFDDNRAALSFVLDTAPAPQARIAAFDRAGKTFVAGSLMYSENLYDFLVFLAFARGAADHLAPSGHGLAIIKNFVFGDPDSEDPTAAMRMMPTGQSHFLGEGDRASAVPAFRDIAEAMLDEKELPDFPVRDQMGELR